MVDIVLETVRAVILFGIVLFLLKTVGAYGVDEVQGYYYSHPLPADDVAEFVAEIAAPACAKPELRFGEGRPSNRVATRA